MGKKLAPQIVMSRIRLLQQPVIRVFFRTQNVIDMRGNNEIMMYT